MRSASPTETGQDEAIEYLSQLIQAHLVATMKHLKGQGLASTENISTSPDVLELVTQLFIDSLEGDNDSVLACLVRDLLQARETADEATAEAIETLLRQTVETTLARQEDAKLRTHAELKIFQKSSAIKQFLLSILEDLLRRDQENDEIEDMDEDEDPGDEMENSGSDSDSFSSKEL